jgi:hypothetical protein
VRCPGIGNHSLEQAILLCVRSTRTSWRIEKEFCGTYSVDEIEDFIDDNREIKVGGGVHI